MSLRSEFGLSPFTRNEISDLETWRNFPTPTRSVYRSTLLTSPSSNTLSNLSYKTHCTLRIISAKFYLIWISQKPYFFVSLFPVKKNKNNKWHLPRTYAIGPFQISSTFGLMMKIDEFSDRKLCDQNSKLRMNQKWSPRAPQICTYFWGKERRKLHLARVGQPLQHHWLTASNRERISSERCVNLLGSISSCIGWAQGAPGRHTNISNYVNFVIEVGYNTLENIINLDRGKGRD